MKRTNGDFYHKLISLVLPITIQSFMLALVSATDAMMLGLVDQTSLSAVSLAGQVQFVLSLFVTGMAAGMAIIIAQYWGKMDTVTIERVVPIALRMNLIFGGIFTIASLVCPELLMRFFTNDTALIAGGADYLRAVSLSYILCAVSQIYLTLLKNTDHAGLSSKISCVAVVLNIILNAILIFGTRRPGRVRVVWKGLFARQQELAKDFWHYTTPMLGASLVWGIAYTLYSVIMGHMGSDAVAANSITSIAKSMISCLIRGVAGGTGIIVGNLLGAGALEKAKDYAKRLTIMSIIVGIGTGGLLMAASPLIVKIAPLSETAAGYLQGMLLFCGINIMFQSVNATVLDGVFCSGGDSQFDMKGNIGAMWCFSVPFGFLAAFVFKWPVLAVYCIVNLDEIVKIPAVYLRYKKYIWVRNITRENTLEA